ncbi:MAG: hypothetical protein WC967_10795 [Balneolaceae bacterium]
MKKAITYIAAFILASFGLITLFLSTSVILDLFGVRAKEGDYVLFIVWANFLSSIIYLIAAYGILATKKWTAHLLGASVIILIAAFIGLFFHISKGGIYETKTVFAMVFRILITLVFTVYTYYSIIKNPYKKEFTS